AEDLKMQRLSTRSGCANAGLLLHEDHKDRKEVAMALRDRCAVRVEKLSRSSATSAPSAVNSESRTQRQARASREISASVLSKPPYGHASTAGEVAEWSIAPHSKCGLPQGNEGSNPSLSAMGFSNFDFRFSIGGRTGSARTGGMRTWVRRRERSDRRWAARSAPRSGGRKGQPIPLSPP